MRDMRSLRPKFAECHVQWARLGSNQGPPACEAGRRFPRSSTRFPVSPSICSEFVKRIASCATGDHASPCPTCPTIAPRHRCLLEQRNCDGRHAVSRLVARLAGKRAESSCEHFLSEPLAALGKVAREAPFIRSDAVAEEEAAYFAEHQYQRPKSVKSLQRVGPASVQRARRETGRSLCARETREDCSP